jgi:hypothetical protein
MGTDEGGDAAAQARCRPPRRARTKENRVNENRFNRAKALCTNRKPCAVHTGCAQPTNEAENEGIEYQYRTAQEDRNQRESRPR